ncbi:MAG: uncharacterized protein HW416_2978 [Chloroflexi bacterium]|nr:uncharacterized protein [Chloroflexota bacterium]
MTRHDDRVTLRQMLDHAEEAIAALGDRSKPELEADRFLGLVLVRLAEIVGEAARRLSDDLRQRHPEAPWPQIIGLRNRLIHGYDQVDVGVVWDVVHNDFPTLAAQLRRVLEQEPSAGGGASGEK